MKNSSNSIKEIGVLIVGTIVGSALGVLFAPHKGSETRSKILNRGKNLAEDLRNKMKDEASALRSEAEELEGLAEDKTNDITKSVKQKVHDLKYQG